MGTELETKPVETEKPAGEEAKKEEIPQLDPNMKIQTDRGEVVLGEAIKSHFAAQDVLAAPQFTPEQVEKYNLMQKALDGDAEAGRQLWDQSLPKKEAEVVDPKSEQGQIQALQKQVGELQLATQQTGQVSKDIVDAANAQQAAQLITGAKKEFPWLAQHPAGAHKLVKRIQDLNEIAQQRNVDPTKPEVFQKIRTAAFQSLNGEIETEMKPYGVTAESLAALTEQVQKTDAKQNALATGIVDDQQKGGRVVIDENGMMNEDYNDGRRFGSDALDGDIPAIRSRFAVTPLGQLIERSTEQLMANAQSFREGQTKPIRPEDLKGTAAGRNNLEAGGHLSRRTLQEQLRARLEEVG